MGDNTKVMKDGFSTIITLENIPTVKLFEKEVTPPQISMGGGIDTTTMRNTGWRTMAAKSLKTLGKVAVTAAYATIAIDSILAQIGINQQITITYPDGSTVSFFGFLDEFTPGQHKEGDQPTAALSIQPTNIDADDDSESGLEYAEEQSSES
jgi:hypothetical protein